MRKPSKMVARTDLDAVKRQEYLNHIGTQLLWEHECAHQVRSIDKPGAPWYLHREVTIDDEDDTVYYLRLYGRNTRCDGGVIIEIFHHFGQKDGVSVHYFEEYMARHRSNAHGSKWALAISIACEELNMEAARLLKR